MIDALIAGRLHAAPVERTTQAGKPFATAKLVCATGNGESMFVDVVAFAADACAALLALGTGDSVAVTGPLSAKVYTDRHGDARPSLSVVAHGVLNAYQVQRRRKAADGARTHAQHQGPKSSPAMSGAGGFDDLESDL